MRAQKSARLAGALPYLWLAVFFLFPFLLVFKLSFSDVALAIPPYQPKIDWSRGLAGVHAFLKALDLETYRRLLADPLYLDSFLSSLKFAAVATALLLLVGYPMALGMARSSPRARGARALGIRRKSAKGPGSNSTCWWSRASSSRASPRLRIPSTWASSLIPARPCRTAA